LQFDPYHRLTFKRLKYEKTVYSEVRDSVSSGFITRLADDIWGYQLPSTVTDQYSFRPVVKLVHDVDPELMKRLIANFLAARLHELGFERVGHDKFERAQEVAFTAGQQAEIVAGVRWLIRPFYYLDDQGGSVYGLFMNPRLAYRFSLTLLDFQRHCVDWRLFGERIRVDCRHPDASCVKPFVGKGSRVVLQVVRAVGDNTLRCRDAEGTEGIIEFGCASVLPSAQNRYRYLHQRYGSGATWPSQMKSQEKDFFALANVQDRINALKSVINAVDIEEGFTLQVRDFETVTLIHGKAIDKAQEILLARPEKAQLLPILTEDEEGKEIAVDESEEEVVDEMEDEFIQLPLFGFNGES
jgi:hypothetical protein